MFCIGFSSDLCCRRRETDEETARRERDGATDRQKSSVHLHWIPVDQRAGNYSTAGQRENTQEQ